MYVYDYIRLTRNPLLRGRGQYSKPPRTNQFRSVAVYIETVIYLIHKTNYPNEEFNGTKTFPLISVPCSDI